jgi:hypothetical protein
MMRVLPRSARGTWLLAAMTWAGACAGAWGLLPGMPRTTLHLPVEAELVGFGPNGDTVLVRREISRQDCSWSESGFWEMVLLDRSTGRLVATLVDRFEGRFGTRILGVSTDHRTWLVEVDTRPQEQIFKFDLTAGTAEPLPPHLVELADNWRPTLSPDGRLCAFPDPIPHPDALVETVAQTVFWDVANNRCHAVLAGPYASFAFSADGRVVAAEEFRTGRVRVFDRDTLTPGTTVSGPADNYVSRLSLSDDGKHVTANFGPRPSDRYWYWSRRSTSSHSCYGPPGCGLGDTNADLVCCDTGDGAAHRFGSLADGRFAGGGSIVVAFDYSPGIECLRGIDAVSGRVLFAIPEAKPLEWDVSPDGRALLVISGESGSGRAEQLVRRLGLPWPFATAAGRGMVQINDAITGRLLGQFPVAAVPMPVLGCDDGMARTFPWLPGGRTLAVMPDPDHPNVWDLWDVPPRKSLTSFAAATLALALPVTGLAYRRSRRLRTATGRQSNRAGLPGG